MKRVRSSLIVAAWLIAPGPAWTRDTRLWQRVQFQSVVGVLGGFQTVRVEHFIGMSILVGFILVHVALSLLVPATLRAMILGGPRVSRRERA